MTPKHKLTKRPQIKLCCSTTKATNRKRHNLNFPCPIQTISSSTSHIRRYFSFLTDHLVWQVLYKLVFTGLNSQRNASNLRASLQITGMTWKGFLKVKGGNSCGVAEAVDVSFEFGCKASCEYRYMR